MRNHTHYKISCIHTSSFTGFFRSRSKFSISTFSTTAPKSLQNLAATGVDGVDLHQNKETEYTNFLIDHFFQFWNTIEVFYLSKIKQYKPWCRWSRCHRTSWCCPWSSCPSCRTYWCCPLGCCTSCRTYWCCRWGSFPLCCSRCWTLGRWFLCGCHLWFTSAKELRENRTLI